MTLTQTQGRRWTPLSIATLVLGFVIWWPLGFAILAYILWGGHMDSDLKRLWNRINGKSETVQPFTSPTWSSQYSGTMNSSGNAVFDRYKEETLRRLEEEQQAFNDYVNKLRAARDQEEFDRFMEERRRQTGSTSSANAA
jgi:hypothetical protein